MNKVKGELFLSLTTIIWGISFVFQSSATEFLGAFTFNGIRFLLGSLSLIPLLIPRIKGGKINYRQCICLGVIIGIFLCIGSNLQQIAISYTSVGKAGFITALYMIFVPVLGYILYKDNISKILIIAICIAVVGLFLLCGADFSFNLSDILLLLTALSFAMQIIFIGKYGKELDAIFVSFVEYLVCTILSLIIGLFIEDMNFVNILNASHSLLFTGVMSTGVAYTLQMIGQKDCPSTIASLILACESLVSALAGWVVLNQSLSVSELIGCLLMFIAIILSQIDYKPKISGLTKKINKNTFNN